MRVGLVLLLDEKVHNVANSKKYEENMSHLKKEIEDFLQSGKNLYIFLSKKESYPLASSVTSPRKGQNTYNTYTKTNYDFLPINIGAIVSASGKHIEFSGNSIFNDLYKKFKGNLEYQVYVENINNSQVVFTGKDKTKILGAIYKAGNGNVVTLPYLKYDTNKFIEYREKEDKSYWTDEAVKFGNNFIDCLLAIDQQLLQDSEKTPPPKWSNQEKFSSKKTIKIEKEIQQNEKEIKKIKSKNNKLYEELSDENVLKDLLFEQGKPLENAVIKALHILGYEAENYDDGSLELDQVILSPEKYRFIGECEGKDNKDINITKFRQLLESLNADFARDEVEEKALGILFGNPERLKDPNERTLDFTQKCKTWAEREKIALVNTVDLFTIVNYLNENKNEECKKACRQAILDWLWWIVKFPNIPN
ncbi:MAG: hypothetical protein ACD_4C00022G0003 [uncultured bacterium (gcode 4)]|uniref:Uncharacterized protein n=1 Tax=uncultured bacterium (gcode 4) TaxID=1234023 RepID=K2GV42_9BACT|nr:MAG: hypothetical protein ACD_4C00022G0003 [uncultured bacterium (gcode 4)]